MTLCLIYKTKYSEQSSDMIRDAIKKKYLSTCSLQWDSSNICTETSCLNQMCQSKQFFTLFVVLTTDLSTWTVSENERASVYCIHCRQDSSRDCNFYLLLTWSDTHIQHNQDVCKLGQAIKQLNASGWGLWWEECIHRCIALEAVFMQMFVPGRCHFAPQIQTELE